MLEQLGKNLWMALTVAMPGMFTYGAWRLILLLQPSTRISPGALEQLDASGLVTSSVVLAVALIQQAVAMIFEGALTIVAFVGRKRWHTFFALMCGRFEHAADGALSENATRIIGNFFLSTNISIGLGLLYLYFRAYEPAAPGNWVCLALAGLLAVGCLTSVLRFVNALWVVARFREEDWR